MNPSLQKLIVVALTWLVGVGIALWFHRRHSSRIERIVPVAARDNAEPVGKLSWSIVESATDQVIAEEARAFGPQEIQVVNILQKGRRAFYKSVALTPSFTLSIAEHPTPTESQRSGFGLFATRKDQTTFCWEWFECAENGRAVKLQEDGLLAIRTARSPYGWELVELEFLTDVSLRVFSEDQVVQVVEGEAPRWRVTIHQGSTLVFPLGTGEWPVLDTTA